MLRAKNMDLDAVIELKVDEAGAARSHQAQRAKERSKPAATVPGRR